MPLRRDFRPLIFALALLAITTLPYVIGFAQQNDQWRFSGSLFGVDDGNSYLAKMRFGGRGEWDFSLFYTTEPHTGAALVFLPYILPGQIAGRLVPETEPAHTTAILILWQLMRLAFDALYLWLLWRFISAFLAQRNARFAAFVMASIGGGIGWILPFIGGGLPPEFYIPEGFSFLIILGLPHLALARAAMLGGFLALFAAQRRSEKRAWIPYALLAGCCWLITGMSVPFYFGVIYVLLGMWGLLVWLRNRQFPTALFLRCLLAGLITLPFFAYYTLVFGQNQVFSVWSAQNQLPSPSPLVYLAAYLLPAIPAAAGAVYAWRRGRSETHWLLLIAWVAAAFTLVYLPINVQRRMLEGVIVPLSLLAACGLMNWAGERARRHIFAWIWVGATAIPAVLLLVGTLNTVLNPQMPVFRPAAEVAALEWLNRNAAPGDVILASFETGNAIPVYTHLRSFIGHGPETLEADRKALQVEALFSGTMTDEQRAALLAGGGCLQNFPDLCGDPLNWLIFGESERQMMAGGEDAFRRMLAREGWRQVYNADGWEIYERISSVGDQPPNP